MTRFLPLALLAATLGWLVGVEAALAGGWVVVTLEALPTGLRPDQEFTVGFWVRQHGVRPVDGLHPVVEFYHAESAISLSFPATGGQGVTTGPSSGCPGPEPGNGRLGRISAAGPCRPLRSGRQTRPP